MAIGDGLSPSYVKVYYESSLGPHTQTIPVNLVAGGIPGGTFELFQKNNTQVNWTAGMDTYATTMRANLPNTTTIQYAELFWQETEDHDPAYLDSHIINLAGTHVAPLIAASQAVWSIRSDLGGKAFLYLMDTPYTPNAKHKAPLYGNAAVLAMVTYLIGSTSIFLCRDNGYPVTVTKVLTKTNDALRRRYRLS